MTTDPRSIQDVESIAAKIGIPIESDWYAQAHALAEQRRQQIEATLAANEPTKTGWAALVEEFNKFYPKFLRTLLGISDVLIVFAQTCLIAGVPILLIMLLIVEQQRVDHGMALFEVTGPLATFSAVVLVLANLVFELLISWRENQAGYTEPPKHEFSLRILASRAAYMVGQSSDWQPRPKSPAGRFKNVLRVITITILVLALAGSMQSVIEQTSGNWFDALKYVFTQSTLLQAVTWLGGLLFAFAAVLSAQALSQYVAQKVIEITAILNSNVDDKSARIAESTGLTAAMFLYGKLKDAQRTRRQLASAADMPQAGIGGSIPITVPNTVPNGIEQRLETLSPAVKKAAQWLIEHPQYTSVRTAAKQAGVSPTTMQSAKQFLEAQGED